MALAPKMSWTQPILALGNQEIEGVWWRGELEGIQFIRELGRVYLISTAA